MENRNFIITNAHKFGHNSKGIELSDIKNDVDLLIINHFSAKNGETLNILSEVKVFLTEKVSTNISELIEIRTSLEF